MPSHPSWREERVRRSGALAKRSAVDATANTLAGDINAVAVVNPVNLVALTLLSTPKHAADLQLLARQIGHVQAPARRLALGRPASSPARILAPMR
jgi:glycerol-3-phosphate O-acyltransferase